MRQRVQRPRRAALLPLHQLRERLPGEGNTARGYPRLEGPPEVLWLSPRCPLLCCALDAPGAALGALVPVLLQLSSKGRTVLVPGMGAMLLGPTRPCRAGSGPDAAAELQVMSLVVKTAFGLVSDLCPRVKDASVAVTGGQGLCDSRVSEQQREQVFIDPFGTDNSKCFTFSNGAFYCRFSPFLCSPSM